LYLNLRELEKIYYPTTMILKQGSMCGIVGIWDFKNRVEESVLVKMRDCLQHRGPDDQGLFISDRGNVGLAQSRLSILDLSPSGHQPMSAQNSQIVFNGEVYNFQAIKENLTVKGCSFNSNSDTEVVLKSYLANGVKSLDDFRGMFAFAVWDESKQELFLARDRTGIKPLYYYWHDSLFIFASEIKAILQHPKVKKELDMTALSLFLQMGCVPAPYCIFKNIFKLEPGHYITINQTQNLVKTKYWDVSDYYLTSLDKINQSLDESAVTEQLENLLMESFKLRMVSDVEVGMFLSGGIDSSLLAAILTKKLGYNNIKTFTIGFNEAKYNEAEHAKRVAEHLGTDHHELYCSARQALELIPKIADIYDEPFGDNSALPTYLLSQFTRNQVKVSLSADGGDETFCGYDRYVIINNIFRKFNGFPKFVLKSGLSLAEKMPVSVLANLYNLLSFQSHEVSNTAKKVWKVKRKIDKLRALLDNPSDVILFYQLLGYGFWKDSELDNLLIGGNPINSYEYLKQYINCTSLNKLDQISQMQLMDYKTYLADDILVKVDRATMAVGLEGRDPLLDHKIIEFVAALPLELKHRNGVTKYILRQILYKYVPRELVDRPKQGFNIPMEQWLRTDLKPLVNDYLSKERIGRQGIFAWDFIQQEKKKFFDLKMDFSDHLWLLLVFELWREKWFK